MAEFSSITWTDHTHNPWIGCTKVGPGCDACYAAELMDTRYGRVKWGPGEARSRTSLSNRATPLKWQKRATAFAETNGHLPRVFMASLADVFDNEVDPVWRSDAFDAVRACPDLRWTIVTKRIGNVVKMLPPDWGDGWPHVAIVATIVNQEEYDRDAPKLRAVPAKVRGISFEPLLGPISARYQGAGEWWIVGGESQQGKHRPRFVDGVAEAARSLRDQAAMLGAVFHMKQMANDAPIPDDLMIRNFPWKD